MTNRDIHPHAVELFPSDVKPSHLIRTCSDASDLGLQAGEYVVTSMAYEKLGCILGGAALQRVMSLIPLAQYDAFLKNAEEDYIAHIVISGDREVSRLFNEVGVENYGSYPDARIDEELLSRIETLALNSRYLFGGMPVILGGLQIEGGGDGDIEAILECPAGDVIYTNELRRVITKPFIVSSFPGVTHG